MDKCIAWYVDVIETELVQKHTNWEKAAKAVEWYIEWQME